MEVRAGVIRCFRSSALVLAWLRSLRFAVAVSANLPAHKLECLQA